MHIILRRLGIGLLDREDLRVAHVMGLIAMETFHSFPDVFHRSLVLLEINNKILCRMFLKNTTPKILRLWILLLVNKPINEFQFCFDVSLLVLQFS